MPKHIHCGMCCSAGTCSSHSAFCRAALNIFAQPCRPRIAGSASHSAASVAQRSRLVPEHAVLLLASAGVRAFQGGTTWTAVTLSKATLDCWLIDAAAAGGEPRARCLWSVDVPLALTRFSGVVRGAALRLARAADALCVLCAAQRNANEQPRGAAGEGAANAAPSWRLALAWFRLPNESAPGVMLANGAPACHLPVHQSLNAACVACEGEPLCTSCCSAPRGTPWACQAIDINAGKHAAPSQLYTLQLHKANSAITGTGALPEPRAYHDLGIDVHEELVHVHAAPAWRLAVRPDLPSLVTTHAPQQQQPQRAQQAAQVPCSVFMVAPALPAGGSAAVGSGCAEGVFATTATSGGSIVHKATATRCMAWNHCSGAQTVLAEVSDASEVVWSAAHGCWQVASAVFGILLLKDSFAVDARLPVAPLLDAAIARYLAGAQAAAACAPGHVLCMRGLNS